MSSREIPKKLAVVLTLCFTVLVFSGVFVLAKLTQPPQPVTSGLALGANSTLVPEELKPREIDEGLETLTAAPMHITVATAPKTEPESQSGSVLTTSTTAVRRTTASTPQLTAPAHALPNRLADLTREPSLRMHWDRVRGAQRYHVRAWQFVGSRQVILLDKVLDGTELHVEPPYDGIFYWQVAGVSPTGAEGATTGPLAIELTTHVRN